MKIGSFPWRAAKWRVSVSLIATLTALSSCIPTTRPGSVILLMSPPGPELEKRNLPSLAVSRPVAEGPEVAFGDPIDARADTIVFRRATGSLATSYAIGSEIATYTRQLLENRLTNRGFKLVHDGKAATTLPDRLVIVTVSEATDTSCQPFAGFWGARVTIVLTVQDHSSKTWFTQTYRGEQDTDGFVKSCSSRDFGGFVVETVSQALDDAVKKASDDPAFIAGIAQPTGASLDQKLMCKRAVPRIELYI